MANRLERRATPRVPHPGPRLLVIGINYAPELTGSGPYTAGLAEMAVESGYDVHVLAGVPHYPSWSVHDGYRWRLRKREVVDGVAVQRLRHFVPGKQSAVTRALWEGTFLAQTLTARLPWRPDVIVASTPSLSGAVAAAKLSARTGTPFGAVVQDVVGAAAVNAGLDGSGRVASAVSATESWALRRAAHVAAVSERFLPQLRAYGVPDDRLRVLANWSRIEPTPCDRAEARRRLGWDDEPFVVLHTGNMGLKQDLHNVVDAARLAEDRRDIRFVLVGDGNQRASVVEHAAGLDNLQVLPPVDAEEYPLLLAAADVLLVSERASTGDMSLPSKLTSYLAAGRPVLAAASADGACARELSRTDGAAVVVAPGEPANLLGALLALQANPARLAQMGRRAARYAVGHLSRDAARDRTMEFLSDVRAAEVDTARVEPAWVAA